MNHLDAVDWPVRTERLVLRRTTPSDADAVWRIRAAPGVSEWLTADATDRAGFDESFSRPERMAVSLVMERGGAIVGDLMLRDEPAWAQAEVADAVVGTQAEIGWVLDPAHAGEGLATEAVDHLLRIGFEEIGLRRIVAYCYADNERSWRLMERLGMRRETHTLADSLHRNGRWLDGFGYAILADEWRAR